MTLVGTRIPLMPAATTLTGDVRIPAFQSPGNVYVTPAQVVNYVSDQTRVFPVSRYYNVSDGNNLRPAYQAAITAAAAVNGRVINDYGAVTQQLWEPAVVEIVTLAGYYASRTLSIPGCSGFSIDFNGAKITLKGPTGGTRFPGQINATAATSGLSSSGQYLGGFLTISGVIGELRIANVDVEGGFTGDTVNQANFNLYDKGVLFGDKGDVNLGAGLGCGRLIMDNVVLHGFGGEIMSLYLVGMIFGGGRQLMVARQNA